jgi:hypothetical protein
VPGYGATRTKW